MFTFEQTPFIRITAKKALLDGKMSQERYDELMSLLAKMEYDRKKIDEQTIKAARKSLLNRQTPVYT